MNLLIIGHVLHKHKDGRYFAYGPYVKEINLWAEYADRITLLVPIDETLSPDPIDLPYVHDEIELKSVPQFNLTSLKECVKTVFRLPYLVFKTWSAMGEADHILLRCPGNMGLLGAIIQIFFPKKMKSAKYAGNWDKKSKQPLTYKIQQAILRSPFFSRNMQVLVYGDWPGESKNVRSFFTASYSESEKNPVSIRIPKKESVHLVFAGTLNEGKRPMLSVEVAQKMYLEGIGVRLDIYGEGPQRKDIEDFISTNKLENIIFVHGNVNSTVLSNVFKKANFLIFVSQSEGWPKVVAEAMFWGCLPITTSVSCVPQMLGFGDRGNLVNPNVEEIFNTIVSYFDRSDVYIHKSQQALNWSRMYTLERFKEELKSVITR